MLKTLKNKKGSAIVWALLVLAMLSLLIAAALTISFSYLQRSRSGVDSQQCYFTARSAAEGVASDIINKKSASAFYPAAGETLSAVWNVPADKLGSCTVAVSNSADASIQISAAARRRTSAYTYVISLAPDAIPVPTFSGGLFTAGIGESNIIKEVRRDLYIYGGGTSYITFPVYGDVFAPGADIVVTGGGSILGSVFAKSIKYEGITTASKGYIPLYAVSRGDGSQTGVDVNSMSYALSDGDFTNIKNIYNKDPDARASETEAPDGALPLNGTSAAPTEVEDGKSYAYTGGVDAYADKKTGKDSTITVYLSGDCSFNGSPLGDGDIFSLYFDKSKQDINAVFVLLPGSKLSVKSEDLNKKDKSDQYLYSFYGAGSLVISEDTALTNPNVQVGGFESQTGKSFKLSVNINAAVPGAQTLYTVGWRVAERREG